MDGSSKGLNGECDLHKASWNNCKKFSDNLLLIAGVARGAECNCDVGDVHTELVNPFAVLERGGLEFSS
jgi:hypothetical protein